MLNGLESVTLPGRCQQIREGLYEWYIDGAHIKDSLDVADRWYADSIQRYYGFQYVHNCELKWLVLRSQSREGRQFWLTGFGTTWLDHVWKWLDHSPGLGTPKW